jgi:hypothetical protein
MGRLRDADTQIRRILRYWDTHADEQCPPIDHGVMKLDMASSRYGFGSRRVDATPTRDQRRSIHHQSAPQLCSRHVMCPTQKKIYSSARPIVHRPPMDVRPKISKATRPGGSRLICRPAARRNVRIEIAVCGFRRKENFGPTHANSIQN